MVGIRVFRPFPKKDVIEAYRKAKAIILFEKSISYGYEGGLCSDLKAAFYGSGIDAAIHDHVAGLGGRDVKARELVEAVKSSLARIKAGRTGTRNHVAELPDGVELCRRICLRSTRRNTSCPAHGPARAAGSPSPTGSP